jgi:hypothetical protein
MYCFIYLTDSVSFIIISFAYKQKEGAHDVHSVFYFAYIASQKHGWGSVQYIIPEKSFTDEKVLKGLP